MGSAFPCFPLAFSTFSEATYVQKNKTKKKEHTNCRRPAYPQELSSQHLGFQEYAEPLPAQFTSAGPLSP